MKSKSCQFQVIPVVILYSILFLFNCNDFETASRWCDSEIKIDGIGEEWRNDKMCLEGKKYTIGFKNDSAFLYVLLSTRDSLLQMQILRFGFIISFDPEGEKRKSFGIRFPLENKKQIFSRKRMNEEKDSEPPPPDLRLTNRGLEILQLKNVLGKKHTFSRYMLTVQAKQYGIESHIAIDKKELVYELKLPLHSSEQFKYALNVGEHSNVAICFETTEMEFDGMGPNKPHGPSGGGILPPGGMQGGGSMGGGMRPGGMGKGGMPPHGNPPAPVKIKQWITVNLSSGEKQLNQPEIPR